MNGFHFFFYEISLFWFISFSTSDFFWYHVGIRGDS